jgi:hypothetical protein
MTVRLVGKKTARLNSIMKKRPNGIQTLHINGVLDYNRKRLQIIFTAANNAINNPVSNVLVSLSKDS